MGKSSPPPIDYTAAAASQGAANKETAIAQANLNNPNMVTPYGTSTYTGPDDGSGRGTLTQVLSPAEQAKLDASNAIQQQSLGILSGDMPNIQSALSGPFGMAGAPIQGYDPKYAIGTTKTDANLGAGGPIQSGLNFAGSPGLVGTDPATRQAIANATYQQGAQYLDPQFAQEQSDLTSKLANQGITPGSDAYNREMLNFQNQKQRAYSDLTNSSILGGNAAQAQLAQTALANRGQISGETQASGQFLNAAQQQAVNELLSNLQANNAGVAQQANIAQNSTQLANAGRAQAYQEYANNRTMPINMLNALLSSSQVNNPTFQPTQPTAITPAPILQGATLAGQQNAATSSANAAGTGQAMGLVGTLGMAAAVF
jgi:hypothetical protein